VKGSRKKKFVVPLGAILAAKGPQQQKWQDRHFNQTAPGERRTSVLPQDGQHLSK
jgi:hypothetical protein